MKIKWKRPTAHAMLSYVAQGAAMAIEDAYAVADFLSRQPDNIEAALQAYEAARLPRTAKVQMTARQRGQTNHLTSRWARLRRDMGYAVQKLLKPSQHTYKIEWIYGHDVTSGRV